MDFADEHYRNCVELSQHLNITDYNEDTIFKPGDKRFTVPSPGCSGKYGYVALPHPAFGDHPLPDLCPIYDRDEDVSFVLPIMAVDEAVTINFKPHNHGVVFNLDKPIEPQLAVAKEELLSKQRFRHGKRVKQPRHPEKWAVYLRVLDADEAGASLSEMAEILPARYGRRDGKAADNVRDQARKLQFRF